MRGHVSRWSARVTINHWLIEPSNRSCVRGLRDETFDIGSSQIQIYFVEETNDRSRSKNAMRV
jgi:hypothetical protein